MNPLQLQVAQIRRRLTVRRWLVGLPFALLLGWSLALIGIAIPKLFVINLSHQWLAQWWNVLWIAAATLTALLVHAVLVLRRPATNFQAANLIDHEIGLNEMAATAIAIVQRGTNSPAEAIVVEDANQALNGLNLQDLVSWKPPSSSWASLVPLVAIVATIVWAPDAQPPEPDPTVAELEALITPTQLEESTDAIKEALKEKLKLAEEAGLAEATELFESLQKQTEELSKPGELSRKDALVKINDLMEQLENRAKELGSSEEMKKALNRLDKLKPGPADKLMKSLKEGDFDQAASTLQDLADRLANDDMSPEDTEQLQQQLNDLADQLNQRQAELEQQKQDLQRQLEQAQNEGDTETAAELQEKLDQLQQQQDANQQTQDLADALRNAAENLQAGGEAADGGNTAQAQQARQQAQQQLQGLADKMQQMQQQSDELESVEGMLQNLSDVKGGLCENPGDGSQPGQGSKPGNGQGSQPGNRQAQGSSPSQAQGSGKGNGQGMGEGQGTGERPIEENDTQFYDSKVDADIQPGEVVITGKLDGPNRSGQSRAAVQEAIRSALNSEDVDPIGEQRLPRSKRNQVKEYFERFRKQNDQ